MEITFVENTEELRNFEQTVQDKTFIKEDKNKTNYFQGTVTCGRCNGKGYIPYYNFNGGVCFGCGGLTRRYISYKVITEQHNLKLKHQQEKRIEKRRQEYLNTIPTRNAEFLSNHNFNSQGESWLVLGETYSIQDNLKSLGAKWINDAYYIDHSITEYPCIMVNVDDMYQKDNDGCYTYSYKDMNYIQNLKNNYNKKLNENCEYYGNVNDKVKDLQVTVQSVAQYVTLYGPMNVITFKDNENHIFVWKTSTSIKCPNSEGEFVYPQRDDKVVITKGTIKSHTEYKEIKQTNLVRVSLVM